MTDNEPKKRSFAAAVVNATLTFAGVLLLLLVLGVGVLLATSTVGGGATLPNGAQVDITSRWGFGVDLSRPNKTTINIAGSDLVFTPDKLTIDGEPVDGFDSQATRHTLISDSAGLRLITEDQELFLR